jgi:hypothetical protein
MTALIDSDCGDKCKFESTMMTLFRPFMIGHFRPR